MVDNVLFVEHKVFSAAESLDKVVEKAALERPDLIKSTILRKYIATTIQVSTGICNAYGTEHVASPDIQEMHVWWFNNPSVLGALLGHTPNGVGGRPPWSQPGCGKNILQDGFNHYSSSKNC